MGQCLQHVPCRAVNARRYLLTCSRCFCASSRPSEFAYLCSSPRSYAMQITIKVMSESGTKCLLSIAEQMPIALFVSSICDAALDPHAMCRAQVSLSAIVKGFECRNALVECV